MQKSKLEHILVKNTPKQKDHHTNLFKHLFANKISHSLPNHHCCQHKHGCLKSHSLDIYKLKEIKFVFSLLGSSINCNERPIEDSSCANIRNQIQYIFLPSTLFWKPKYTKLWKCMPSLENVGLYPFILTIHC